MGAVTNVNEKPAYRLAGRVLKTTAQASLIELDGDKVWLPNTTFRDNRNGSIDIQIWILQQKFPNENYV